MGTVRDLLAEKGPVWTVSPGQSLLEALELMAERDTGALVVTEGERVVGIITERDYIRLPAAKHKSLELITVADIMSEHVLYVRPDQSVEEAMALMTDKHLRHLPVLEGEKLVGIVSMRDLVRSLVAQKDFVIGQLENYISGR